MDFRRFKRAFLLTYIWDVRVNASREEIITIFNTKFNSNSVAIGHSTWKTVYFMCPTFLGLMNYSLIGFEGVIEEKQSESSIHLKARFGQPFLFFYIIPAFLFPILYLFTMVGLPVDLNLFNSHFLNIVIPPILIWSSVMVYYQLKIGHAKRFVDETLEDLKV